MLGQVYENKNTEFKTSFITPKFYLVLYHAYGNVFQKSSENAVPN